MQIDHSKSQPTDDKPSLKRAWSLSRDLFNFWTISDNMISTDTGKGKVASQLMSDCNRHL